jgi:hypothetical protein
MQESLWRVFHAGLVVTPTLQGPTILQVALLYGCLGLDYDQYLQQQQLHFGTGQPHSGSKP